jgi:hypothetical protein
MTNNERRLDMLGQWTFICALVGLVAWLCVVILGDRPPVNTAIETARIEQTQRTRALLATRDKARSAVATLRREKFGAMADRPGALETTFHVGYTVALVRDPVNGICAIFYKASADRWAFHQMVRNAAEPSRSMVPPIAGLDFPSWGAAVEAKTLHIHIHEHCRPSPAKANRH